jgi:hypothetical protein
MRVDRDRLASALISGGRRSKEDVLDILAATRSPPRCSFASCSRLEGHLVGHHHQQTGELWCGQARDPAQCRTSATPLSLQPCGKFPSAHPSTGAAHARVQVVRACPALPRRVRHHGIAFPSPAPPLSCSRIPPPDGPEIPDVAGDHRLDNGRIRDTRGVVLPLLYLVIAPR